MYQLIKGRGVINRAVIRRKRFETSSPVQACRRSRSPISLPSDSN
jgi:hypothetical protein